jgi:hypothetical protein
LFRNDVVVPDAGFEDDERRLSAWNGSL